MKRILLALVFLSTLSVSAEEKVVRAAAGSHCLVTKSMSVNDLVDQAGIIFKGQFLSSEVKKQGKLRARKLKFKVLDGIAGTTTGKTITLSEWASISSPFTNGSVVPGKPYVFFFYEPSILGLTSLVGLEQAVVGIDRSNNLKYAERLSFGNSSRLFQTADSKKKMNLNTYNGLKDFCKENI